MKNNKIDKISWQKKYKSSWHGIHRPKEIKGATPAKEKNSVGVSLRGRGAASGKAAKIDKIVFMIPYRRVEARISARNYTPPSGYYRRRVPVCVQKSFFGSKLLFIGVRLEELLKTIQSLILLIFWSFSSKLWFGLKFELQIIPITLSLNTSHWQTKSKAESTVSITSGDFRCFPLTQATLGELQQIVEAYFERRNLRPIPKWFAVSFETESETEPFWTSCLFAKFEGHLISSCFFSFLYRIDIKLKNKEWYEHLSKYEK